MTEKFNQLLQDHAIARNKALRELKFKMANQGLLESSAFNQSSTQVLVDQITQFTQRLWSELEAFLRETHFAVYPGCEQDFTELVEGILANAAATDFTALGSLKALPITVQKSRVDFSYEQAAKRIATNIKILCRKLAPMNTEKTESKTDPRIVFVVHGRNDAAKTAMFEFLRAIDLNPLEWSQIVAATGKPSPYIGEVLDKGFSMARAVVVLWTPDDEARLKPEYRKTDDPPYEAQLTGQARPNVLFEAGMAMGLHPDRTVLVELGNLRPFTDILGRHVVRLNNSVARRQDLADRLRAAGCAVDLNGRTDWHSVGKFEAGGANIVRPAEELTSLSSLIGSTPEQNLTSAEAELVLGAKDGRIQTASLAFRGRIVMGMPHPDDAEIQAKYLDALDSLVMRGLVRSEGSEAYRLTGRGFEIQKILAPPNATESEIR